MESPQQSEPPASKETTADERMAGFLSDDSQSLRRLRGELQDEATPDADDLLGRLSALEFLDSVVGEGLDMPERLGEYEIKGVLGRGGMGSVYLAYQQSLEREVALKVLAPRFSTDLTMRKRFRSEARASAAMHHQHIVPIYDYGEAQGHLYFAMELVHGVSLDRHIAAMRRHDKGFLDPRETARRFAGVADALALAHKRQILHRDVKPGNLMVHRDGTLALVDFGLSKFMDRASMNLTSVGGFLGTLYYSPPEQARSEELTPASDLYSLGVTIFETVTGRLPLRGGSTGAMLQSLLHEEPRRLRQLEPKAPRDLESILDKLLQKDPRHRYTDGEALALDLRRVAEGEPVRIRRQSWAGRLWRKAKRNPVQTAALATAVVLLLVSLVFMRGWISTVGERTLLGGEASLREAYNTALKEAGIPFGPRNELSVLTGIAHIDRNWTSEVDGHLRRARKALGEAEPDRYQNAYFFHPEERVTGLLADGKGLRARRLLQARIGDASPGSADFQMNEVEWLKLYPLYLDRAVACLTASVGDADQARIDLQLASFVRPGAFLPKLLRVFLSWRPTDGPDALISSLTELLSPAGTHRDCRRGAAAMLLAFAGIKAPKTAQLMRFPLDYEVRKRLHLVGLDWLGEPVPGVDAKGWRGLEALLAGGAADALQHLGDRRRMDDVLRQGQQLLEDEIDKTSRLQSWSWTYALLTEETVNLPTELRVRGAIRLLQLEPRRDWLLNQRKLLYDLVKEALLAKPGSPQALRLRALLDMRLGTPQQFADSAKAWAGLEGEARNPDALMCRFRSKLAVFDSLDATSRRGLLIEGVQVIQASADPDAMQARLAATLAAEVEQAEGDRRRDLEAILLRFRTDDS